MTEPWAGSNPWPPKRPQPQERYFAVMPLRDPPSREYVALLETKRTDLHLRWSGVIDVKKPTPYPDAVRLNRAGDSHQLLWRTDNDSFWLWRSVGSRRELVTTDVPDYRKFRLVLQASKSTVWLQGLWGWSEFSPTEFRSVVYWIGPCQLWSGISLTTGSGRRHKIVSAWNMSMLDELFLQLPFDDLYDDAAWALEVCEALTKFLGVEFDRSALDVYCEERRRAMGLIPRKENNVVER